MFAVCCVSALSGGAALTCIAPQTRFEKEIDVSGALLFVGGLIAIGAAMSKVMLAC